MNFCPYCQHDNPRGTWVCENCGQRMYTQPQTEWRSYIDQIAQDYRTGHAKGLVHGLQKDAIQNGWGARHAKGNWGFEFALLVGSDRTNYLTMADWGTTGLIGQIYDDPESIPDNLPAEERLARFENMNFSGGNYGPGLYGRGKLLFQAASQRGSIIYDSLTLDGQYRLGIRFQEGRRLQQFPKVLEGQAAKNMLDKLTSGTLQPLRRAGTRITIVEPLEEIVESLNEGSFVQYIEETWWEILHKHADEIEISVLVNGARKRAKSPALLEKLASGKIPVTSMYRQERQVVTVKGVPYRVKRICMGRASQPVPEELRGLYVQRKGMKVGTVELRDVPADLDEYFFGFIELDKDYEDEIAKSEDLVHYSLAAQFSSFRELKKFAQMHFDEFKRQLGYDVGSEKTADQTARDALRAAHEKLNEIMRHLGLTGFGFRRTVQKEITVSVANVDYPVAGSKRVETGDTISNVKFRVANHSSYDRELKAFIDTRRANGAVIEEIACVPLTLKSSMEETLPPFDIRVKRGLYPNYEGAFCACRVETVTGELQAHARFPIFIGIDPPEEDPVQVRLDNIELPRQNSSRVNYDEEIKNVRFAVKNNMANALDVRVTVVTLDPQYENQEIETVKREDVCLSPMSEYDVLITSLKMDERIYNIVHEGKLKLRCRVTSLKNQHGIDKGKKWTCDVTLWLNTDEPGFGIFEDAQMFDGGPDQPRAKVQSGSLADRWIFLLNFTHPHYESVQGDSQRQQQYSFELMAREALYIALFVENYEPFNNKVTQGDEPYAISKEYNAALDRVLASYYEG